MRYGLCRGVMVWGAKAWGTDCAWYSYFQVPVVRGTDYVLRKLCVAPIM